MFAILQIGYCNISNFEITGGFDSRDLRNLFSRCGSKMFVKKFNSAIDNSPRCIFIVLLSSACNAPSKLSNGVAESGTERRAFRLLAYKHHINAKAQVGIENLNFPLENKPANSMNA